MIFPTYYVKEMYVGFNDSPNILCQRNVCRVQSQFLNKWFYNNVGFKDSPNRHLEFSITKAVGALEPRRHQQLGSLSGEYQDHLHFPQKIKTLFKSSS